MVCGAGTSAEADSGLHVTEGRFRGGPVDIGKQMWWVIETSRFQPFARTSRCLQQALVRQKVPTRT